MDKKKLVLMLAFALMLGSCGKNTNSKRPCEKTYYTFYKQDLNGQKETVTDTLLVVSVARGIKPEDFSYGHHHIENNFMCCDRHGNRYYVTKYLVGYDYDTLYTHMKEGHVIYVENGEIVRNLTLDSIVDNFVKNYNQK